MHQLTTTLKATYMVHGLQLNSFFTSRSSQVGLLSFQPCALVQYSEARQRSSKTIGLLQKKQRRCNRKVQQ